MEIIQKMLAGQIEMKEFVALLRNDGAVQNAIKTLIPQEAKNNKSNELWKKISFETLQKYDFSLFALLMQMCRFDNSIPDNLNIFATIRRVYCFLHPEFICTKKYEELFELYLDTTRDCFDGPEVKQLVCDIVENAYFISSKKKQLEQAKNDIQKHFHVTNTRCPRWINGPEWPMGNLSPMRFVSQTRCGETVKYQFEDVDKGTLKVVEQYY